MDNVSSNVVVQVENSLHLPLQIVFGVFACSASLVVSGIAADGLD